MVAARYWPETDEEDDSEKQTGKGDGKSNVGHNTQGLTLNLKKKNSYHNQSLKPTSLVWESGALYHWY